MHFTPTTAEILTVSLLCSSLVQAMPAHRRSSIKNLTVAEIEARLAARQNNIQVPFNGLPACAGEENDPTWEKSKSAYKDGDGKKVGDDCDNKQKGDNHCWTDYFLVGTTVGYDPWYKQEGDIMCGAGGNGTNCQKQIGKMQQDCKTSEWKVSQGIQAGVEGELMKFQYNFEVSFGESKQHCNSQTTTTTCTWNDKNCHSIWGAQKVTKVHGYKRRSCEAPATDPRANMPKQDKRPDGHYTAGMQDFVIPVAQGNALSCEGTCDSNWHPGDLPKIDKGDELLPWDDNNQPRT